MNETGHRRVLPDQSLGSGHTVGTSRHPYITDPIPAKRVCFYKSGDPQFNGLRMVISNRTFKTFDALLDSLSKKVPLPFGVRNITTPRGVHAVHTLEELEDGKSYICSDRRKVKPINLALARKKLPPWYHARPVSAHRHTPKRLTVFRNGDPSIRHTVMLQKRTTPTFESLLDYVSELMQFHVVKLHTLDGRRVDGLPALILCSGIVVAAGREPFKSGNYNAQKSPVPTRLPTNRTGPRRLKQVNQGIKKSISSISKSRNFSTSSERYILHQIQNSIIESLCNLPSNPADSVELETGHILESVAETEDDTCHGDGTEGQDDCLPTEDNIEKSFRVNQDGSMTVEMRVCLTVKEEETIHWTTTLTRSSVANQLNATCLPEPEPQLQQENSSLESNPTASIDTTKRNKSKDDDDNDSPSLDNGIDIDNDNEKDNVKVQTNAVSPWRAATPGPRQFRKKQASVESLKSVTAEEIQEGMVGSYSYREQTENGAVTEQYCMVKQSNTRPVPKPRRHGSVEGNSRNNRNISTFKSAGMTEILQIETRGEEVSETAFHLYEQQTCQDNFLANSHFCAQGLSMSGILYGRPATSDTALFSSSNDFETELGRPSTASESISIWRAENMSLASDLTMPSLKTGADYISPPVIKVQKQHFPQPTKGKDSFQSSKENPQQRVVSKAKRISSKPKVIKKRIRRIMSPGKRQKDTTADAPHNYKKGKTFSSAEFIKRIYGYKQKSGMIKVKKKHTQNGDGGVKTKTSELSDGRIKCIIQDPNISSPAEENKSEAISFENNMLDVPPTEGSQPRGVLARQKSLHREKKNKNEFYDVNKSMSLPALNSSSSVINEYVEDWLEKAHLNPTVHPDEEYQKVEAITKVGAEAGMSEESEMNCDVIIGAEEVSCLEGKSEIQTCPSSKSMPWPDSLLEPKMKQRIQSFENKSLSSSPSLEKTAITQQIVHTDTIMSNTANCNSLAQNNAEEITPSSDNISYETNTPPTNTLTEMSSDSEVENKSILVKISVQKVTPSNSLSTEKASTPAESSEEKTELSGTEHCVMDASSVVSSPLYRPSSVSSLTSDDRPLSISPDKAPSTTDHTLQQTTSIQTIIPSTLREASLPRNPSVKRARLVSNLSFERKMSLKKASLDKSAQTSDASVETTISSTPINTAVENMLSNSFPSMGTQRPSEALPEESLQSNSILDLALLMSSPSCCTSASPASLTSEERASSASLSSNEAPTPTNLPFKETEVIKTPSHLSTQKEASSPKPLVKKVKLISSPSPQKKLSTRKSSSEKSELHNAPPAEKTQVSSSPYLTRTPLPRNHSLKSASSHNHSLDQTSSPNLGIRKLAVPNSSPSTERQPLPRKAQQQKRLSPYSQSLEVVSPPIRLKSKKKLISRNLSFDNASETTNQTNKTLKKTPPQRKLCQTSLSKTSIDEFPDSSSENTLHCATLMPLNASRSDENKVNKSDGPAKAAQQKSLTEAQIIPQPLFANQPNIKPVLEKICYSIKSIRQITQNKRPSCLEKSNSLPDFSSHVASTFGSSSKALLAFLSVMTLKEGMTNLNMHELNANNVSCAEALKMIDALREISSIEDSHKLETSLSNLQKSTSKQLLQSWKGFQDLSGKCKNRSPTPNYSEQELLIEASPMEDCGVEEHVIDELMNEFDIPEKLKEELAALPASKRTECDDEGKIDANFSHFSKEEAVRELAQSDKANVDVNPIVKKSSINQPGSLPLITETANHKKQNLSDEQNEVLTDQVTKDNFCQDEQNALKETHMAKGPPIDHNDEQISEERQLHNTVAFGSVEDKENQGGEEEQESHNGDQPNQEKSHIAYMDVKKKKKKKHLEEDRCSSEGEQPDEQLQINSEESIPMDELTPDDESCSDEEGQNKPSANKYVEWKVSCEKNITNPREEQQSPSEEEQPEELQQVSHKDASSNPTSQSNSEKEEPELKVITKESLFGHEEDQDSMEEEQGDHTDDEPNHEEQMKKCKALQARREHHADNAQVCDQAAQKKSQNTVRGSLSNLIENQDSYIIKDNSSLIIQPSNLQKHYSFDVDEDSGNDHSSCEEHADEVEQPKAEDEQCSITEDGLSYEEKESSSEEEHANTDRDIEETCAEYQERHVKGEPSEGVTECEKAVEEFKHQSEEIISQSVAERISLLEKQVADAHQRKNMIGSTKIRQTDFVSDVDSTSGTSDLCIRSAPQSSLSFSYDSSGIMSKEPEGNRVRSIKAMFLAKSAADIQHGQRGFPSPNTSELHDCRPETSNSGGYQSQTSSELSSGEDDSSRKSISKGFVRRTIERLYGKKDANVGEDASLSPPSAPKQEKKESSSIFSPFHQARSKIISDLSYFSSTNTLDTLSEATRCIAFNAQVGPGDSVPIDKGRWLLRENTQIRKSVSDPVGINKTLEESPQDEEMCENTKEDVPYSLFSTKSDLEDKVKSVSTKCTYFSLPHASDSDLCQDDLSTVSKSSANGDSIVQTKEDSAENKTWAEKNSMRPAVSVTDFKMPDNKVHPLIEDPPDSEVVVAQPRKGHGVVQRRPQEPDVLDILYTFCGQHCPIL